MRSVITQLGEREIHGDIVSSLSIHHSESDLLVEKGLSSLGLTEVEGGLECARQWPAQAQIVITIDGEGQVLVGKEWRRCGKGVAYVMPIWAPHAYRSVPGERWSFAWLAIRDASVATERMPVDSPCLALGDFDPLILALRGFLSGHRAKLAREALIAWIDLILESASNLVDLSKRRVDYRLARTWARATEDLHRSWDLESLSRLASMSKEHFRRLCHETYSQSPLRRLTTIRLRRAASLLTSSASRISDISKTVGFQDPTAFGKAFRRAFGQTPRQFRKAGEGMQANSRKI